MDVKVMNWFTLKEVDHPYFSNFDDLVKHYHDKGMSVMIPKDVSEKRFVYIDDLLFRQW